MANEETGNRFYFVANLLCLDLVNTEVIQNGSPADLLEGFNDFVAWCVAAQTISVSAAKEALSKWSDESGVEAAFEKVKRFRAVLRRMAESVVEGKNVPQTALTQINELLRERAGYEEVIRDKENYRKRFHQTITETTHLLVPVAESAADLLTTGDLSLVKKCESPDCVLYFYDNTKNHARRWCSMSACGNRAKAAAHYQRIRVRDQGQ
jgi:predicted RNA-binding Zn ribbon-like protein